jgi:adenosylcobinamide-GDP ribazoletransferase
MLKCFPRFFLALSYLTCLPVPKLTRLRPKGGYPGALSEDDQAENLAGLSVYLPAVGLVIGTILYCLAKSLNFLHAPALLLATCTSIVWLALTNGLHFDGLMDTADGIFSHQNQEKVLEIMSDPRAGNFAILTGVSVLLVKVAALASLDQKSLPIVLLLTPAWSRFCEAFAIGRYDYLKASGKGKIWHDTTRFPHDLLVGSLAPVLVICLLPRQELASAWAISFFTVAAGLAVSWWLNRKIGGHTGDSYGAVVELAEVGGIGCFTLYTLLTYPTQLHLPVF